MPCPRLVPFVAAPARARWVMLAAAVLMTLAVSGGTASADPVSCRRAVNTQLGKFVQAKLKLLRKCHEGVLKGSLSGPCPDIATSWKILRAAGELRRAVS